MDSNTPVKVSLCRSEWCDVWDAAKQVPELSAAAKRIEDACNRSVDDSDNVTLSPKAETVLKLLAAISPCSAKVKLLKSLQNVMASAVATATATE